MEMREIICVICPSSCHITVSGDGDVIEEIKGYSCQRGYDYAVAEYTDPRRTLTSTVRAVGYYAPVISVRSSEPLPKALLKECVKVLEDVVVEAPFEIGKPVITNILDTGIDIVLTNE